ncbi:MAG: response regulator transcription factor [Bdellovibrionales bacterium]|nr:response regulator transcription factor [Bdellovibrionales bacterium]
MVDNHESHYDCIRDFADIMEDEIDLDCEYASTGKEALRKIASWDPSVVLLDVFMPDINGYEILDGCEGGTAPIIVTSNTSTEDIRDCALARGATAYIQKSNNPDDMERLFYILAELSDLKEIKH